MEEKDYNPITMGDEQAAPAGGKEKAPPSAPAATGSKDGVAEYIDKKVDLEGLAGDIKALVMERIQKSIPDDRRIMLDLVSQVGELTDEVRQLRKEVESNSYSVFNCPNKQIEDVTAGLAEIRQLLEREPAHRELNAATVESVITLPPPASQSDSVTSADSPPPAVITPPVSEESGADGDVQQTSGTAETDIAPDTDAYDASGQGRGRKKLLSFLGNLLFYAVIIGLVIGAFLVRSGSGGQPTMIAGYSAFTVLTSSMEDVYPKGSLIITRSVDANELEIGDDITYMVSETSSITHRIIGITENYLNTGQRAFETQGVMNETPDKDPVVAANVVGQVIFCSKPLGEAATFVSNNWPILLFFIVVLSGLMAFLRWNFRRDEGREKKRTDKHMTEKEG